MKRNFLQLGERDLFLNVQEILQKLPETLGYNNELKNRYIHVDYKEKSTIHSAIEEDSKCNNCTLEELAILRKLKKNPSESQWMRLMQTNTRNCWSK